MSLPKSQGIRFALSSSMPQGLFGISIHVTVCADCHSSLIGQSLFLCTGDSTSSLYMLNNMGL